MFPVDGVANGTGKRQAVKGLRVEICKANTTRPLTVKPVERKVKNESLKD